VGVATGGAGADTFVLANLKDSLLSGGDRITDLEIGRDSIDAPVTIPAGQIVPLGNVRQLNAAGISAVLTPRSFAANRAVTFTVGTGQRQQTFLALNDKTAGFSAGSDAIINITGYSGRLTDLAIG
jgi:microcystin-dependent protein